MDRCYKELQKELAASIRELAHKWAEDKMGNDGLHHESEVIAYRAITQTLQNIAKSIEDGRQKMQPVRLADYAGNPCEAKPEGGLVDAVPLVFFSDAIKIK